MLPSSICPINSTTLVTWSITAVARVYDSLRSVYCPPIEYPRLDYAIEPYGNTK